MWVIFLLSFIGIFCVAMLGIWITSKLLISMQRDNHKYELEIRDDFKNKTKGEEEK